MLPLRQLDLDCPNLCSLKLCGCQFLKDQHCHIQCPSLDGLDICGTTQLSPETFGRSVRVIRQGLPPVTSVRGTDKDGSTQEYSTDHRPMWQ